jgi:hypothetical protein
VGGTQGRETRRQGWQAPEESLIISNPQNSPGSSGNGLPGIFYALTQW